MIRSSLSASAAHAMVLVSGAQGVSFQRRPNDGTSSVHTSGTASAAPRWLRIDRVGTTITGYESSNGTTWTLVGSATIALQATAYVGLAVTSHNAAQRAIADFSNVRTSGLPAPLQQSGIGSPSVGGSASYANGTFNVTGAGEGISDSSDQFHYVYQQVTGDVEIVARVASLERVSRNTRAGIMIRENLGVGSKFSAVVMTPHNLGSFYQARLSTNGSPQSTSAGSGTPPGWVRLVRIGNQIEAFRSGDGSTWTSVGVDTNVMSSTLLVGLMVSSYSTSTLARATFDRVRVSAATGGTNQPPSVSITSPASGTNFSAPATITLTAAATDPEGRLARVEFYEGNTLLGTDTTAPFTNTSNSVPQGSYTVTARAYDADGGSTTSAPVSITVGGTGNQSPTVAITSPSSGATYPVSSSMTMAANATDPENRMSRVEFYRGSTLLASDSTSPYSYAWSSQSTGTYTLTAVAIDQDGGRTTSAPVSVTVQSGNQPPTVSITSPTNGATFNAPANITITAAANDPEGRLARVEFFEGSRLLGTDTTAPYSNTSSSVAAGTYVVTARAYDSDGGSTTSAPVTITVGGANQPPTVSLTSPIQGAIFSALSTITLSANAADPENRLVRVEFYRSGTLIGSDTSAPYSLLWPSVPAGGYTITAAAIDADGGRTVSNGASITVGTISAVDWDIVFFPSADHNTGVTSYRLNVYAAGANPTTATPITTSDLGKPTPGSNGEIRVDRTAFFSSLSTGTYVLTVSAIGPGGSAQSTPTTFTR